MATPTDLDRVLAAWAKLKQATNTTLPSYAGRATNARDKLLPPHR